MARRDSMLLWSLEDHGRWRQGAPVMTRIELLTAWFSRGVGLVLSHLAGIKADV